MVQVVGIALDELVAGAALQDHRRVTQQVVFGRAFLLQEALHPLRRRARLELSEQPDGARPAEAGWRENIIV